MQTRRSTRRLRHYAAAVVTTAAAIVSVAAAPTGAVPLPTSAHTHSASRAGTGDARAPQAAVKWGACPALPAGATRDSRERCGTVNVPLDYAHPRRGRLTIAVSKIATARPGKRRGYLLLNPGGPGLEGLDMPGHMAATLPRRVLDKYDLIGFDPRGVGHSSPLSCKLVNPSFDVAFPYPGADGSIAKNVATAKYFASRCAQIGPRLRYFTTRNTARDLNRIRRALRVPKISYWGQSYGTYLGFVFASMFPHRTDRVILEGAVDPRKVWQRNFRLWNQGMAARFPDAARVAAAEPRLGLGHTVNQVTKTFLGLADRLDHNPAPVPGTQASVSGALLRAVTYQSLLHNETIPPLVRFWKAAADLNAHRPLTRDDQSALSQLLADSPDEPGVPADNQLSIGVTLLCGDATWSRNLSTYTRHVAADRKRWPLSGGMPSSVFPCAFWKYRPLETPVRSIGAGPRNVLILQNRRDNATPWQTGRGMRRALGARAAFVGADNGGHYVYGTGSHCADAAADSFLIHGTLPARDRYCAGPATTPTSR